MNKNIHLLNFLRNFGLMNKFTSINHDTNEFHDKVDDLYEALADDEHSQAVSILHLIIKKAKTMITLVRQNL